MKKLLFPLLSLLIATTLAVGIFAAEHVEIKMTINSTEVYINGEPCTLDVAPVIRNDRTMFPVKFIVEKLCATAEVDPDATTATIIADNYEIKFVSGQNTATVNGFEKELPSPAFIENGQFYVPVRFLIETLGGTVEWDGETSTVTIKHSGFLPFPTEEYNVNYLNGFDYSTLNFDEHIELGQYEGLNLEGSIPAEITDADVDSYIASIMAETPERKQITDRAAQIGDKIIVNFTGKIDGVAFSGGTAQNYEITLGNGGFIDGFEEGIVGMTVGQTKDVETVFPEEYHSADLAGKTAIFEITLLSIYEEVAPTLTDDYVMSAFGMSTVEEFKTAIKNQLVSDRTTEIKEAKYNLAIANITKTTKIKKYPDGLVSDYMYQQIQEVKYNAEQYGMNYEMLLLYSGYTIETFETAVKQSAESQIAVEMILYAIANAEGFTVTEEECNSLISSVLAINGLSTVEEFCTLSNISAEELNLLAKSTIVYTKAQNFLLENNTFSNI